MRTQAHCPWEILAWLTQITSNEPSLQQYRYTSVPIAASSMKSSFLLDYWFKIWGPCDCLLYVDRLDALLIAVRRLTTCKVSTFHFLHCFLYYFHISKENIKYRIPIKNLCVLKFLLMSRVEFYYRVVLILSQIYYSVNQRPNSWTKSRKSLKSFPPCYSQSPLQLCLRFLFLQTHPPSYSFCKRERRKAILPSLWFKKSLDVYKTSLRTLMIMPRTLTWLYVHEFGSISGDQEYIRGPAANQGASSISGAPSISGGPQHIRGPTAYQGVSSISGCPQHIWGLPAY